MGAVNLVDPECSAIADAYRRRDIRARLPSSLSAKDPMYRRSGSSYDLKCIREYQSFDDPRAIDWKLYGRTDRAFVKEFYDEADAVASLLVDSSASMAERGGGGGAMPDYLRLVASLAYLLLSLGVGVRLWSFSDGLSTGRVSARTVGDVRALCEALLSMRCEGRTDTARSYALWRAGHATRQVFVFSDFHEPALKLRAPSSGTLFLFRMRAPFGSLVDAGVEASVTDPETGAELIVPWDRAEEEAWTAADAERDRVLASLPRTFYRRVDPGQDRAPLYWDAMERLHA